MGIRPLDSLIYGVKIAQDGVDVDTKHSQTLDLTGGATITHNARTRSTEIDLSSVPVAHEQGAGIFRPETYGAAGDGVHDDTAALQLGLDACSPGECLALSSGKTYLVSEAGTKTIGGTANHYCLSIPSGVTLLLNDATIKLADASNATIIINETPNATTDEDVALIGPGTLDGNEANQTAPATGEMPCIRMQGVTRPVVYNVHVVNARDYFGRFLACTDYYYDALRGDDSYGDGWSFGISAAKCEDGFIGSVSARGCSGTYGALEGNPFICCAKRTSIGQVYGDNCAGGHKIQDDSEDVNASSFVYVGGALSTNNSGLKVQGQPGLTCRRVNVGMVASSGCDAEGLVLNNCTDCSVGQFSGDGNAAGGAVLRDVCVEESTRCTIGVISSRNSGGLALLWNTNADQCKAGTVNVYNPTGVAVQSATTGHTRIDEINHTDDRGAGALTTAILYVSGSDDGSCGIVRSNMAASTTQPRVGVTAGNYKYFIERIALNGGADPVFGVVTLSAGTTTAVANGSVWKHLVGGTDNQHPVIQILPWTAAAAALGNMRIVATDYAAGTGFTIQHAVAAGTEKVAYRILGSCVVPSLEA